MREEGGERGRGKRFKGGFGRIRALGFPSPPLAHVTSPTPLHPLPLPFPPPQLTPPYPPSSSHAAHATTHFAIPAWQPRSRQTPPRRRKTTSYISPSPQTPRESRGEDAPYHLNLLFTHLLAMEKTMPVFPRQLTTTSAFPCRMLPTTFNIHLLTTTALLLLTTTTTTSAFPCRMLLTTFNLHLLTTTALLLLTTTTTTSAFPCLMLLTTFNLHLLTTTVLLLVLLLLVLVLLTTTTTVQQHLRKE